MPCVFVVSQYNNKLFQIKRYKKKTTNYSTCVTYVRFRVNRLTEILYLQIGIDDVTSQNIWTVENSKNKCLRLPDGQISDQISAPSYRAKQFEFFSQVLQCFAALCIVVCNSISIGLWLLNCICTICDPCVGDSRSIEMINHKQRAFSIALACKFSCR